MSSGDLSEYAIYSMDVYNDGPIRKLNEGALPSFYQLQKPDGFYAKAYDDGDKIIISYRGTDLNATPQNPNWSFNTVNDIIHGYVTGGGLTPDQARILISAYDDIGPTVYPNAPAVGIGGVQAQDALDFYHQVQAMSESQGKDIVVTGQSLGGGLAGYVSMATGSEATVFEPMPFVDAAVNSGYSIDGASRITSYAVDGEMLQFMRNGAAADIVQAIFDISVALSSVFTPEILPALLLLAPSQYFLRDDQFINTNYLGNPTDIKGVGQTDSLLDLVGQYNGGLDVHGQALMIMDLYSESYGSAWNLSSKSVFGYLLSDGLAESVGVTEAMGLGGPSDKILSMIAYSTQGGGPYGDLAAASLFSDMTKLGQVWNFGGYDLDLRGPLSEIVATYAETAALDGFTLADHALGILGVNGSNSLSINLHDPIWSGTEAGANAKSHLVGMITAEIAAQDPEVSEYVSGLTEYVVSDVLVGIGHGTGIQGVGGSGWSEIVGTDGGDYLSGYHGFDPVTGAPRGSQRGHIRRCRKRYDRREWGI